MIRSLVQAVGLLFITFLAACAVGNPINNSTEVVEASQKACVQKTWYKDTDRDGQGNKNQQKVQCAKPAGYVLNKQDCNDANPAVFKGATEVCDSLDNDCDLQVDEPGAVGESTYYADRDQDGYGDASTSQLKCAQPAGYVTDSSDCEDRNAAVYPGATEVCMNSLDDDCDGDVDMEEGTCTDSGYVLADSTQNLLEAELGWVNLLHVPTGDASDDAENVVGLTTDAYVGPFGFRLVNPTWGDEWYYQAVAIAVSDLDTEGTYMFSFAHKASEAGGYRFYVQFVDAAEVDLFGTNDPASFGGMVGYDAAEDTWTLEQVIEVQPPAEEIYILLWLGDLVDELFLDELRMGEAVSE